MRPTPLRGDLKTAGWLLVSLVFSPLFLTGCAGLYFRDVEAAPQLPPRHTVRAWPYTEYWTGIIFNGEKIGLTHLVLSPGRGGGSPYVLRSEALLAFSFLGFTKHVALKAEDWVGDDLRLQGFLHEYDLDGRKLKLSGKVEHGELVVERENGGRRRQDRFPLTDAVYPSSAIALYPTLQGLAVGRQYTYLVYEGQREELVDVSQRVDAYQESDLFSGRAFRVETSLGGQRSTLWINDRGEPVLEMAWHGILISTLENEKRAKAYVAQASLNKRDVLVEFSRVRPNMSLAHPREITTMRVAVQGLPVGFALPSDRFQQCGPQHGHTQCLIQAASLPDPRPRDRQPGSPATGLAPYLMSTPVIESQDPRIQRTAREIAGTSAESTVQIERLVAWIQAEVTQKPVDVFSALDVLESRKAECQGLTWLYAAFARSLGIPTRVTNGLVYSQELDGFLYHTWAESYVGSGWLPVDPTFGQIGVDATHIKLLEGEHLSDLLPLVDIVGKVRLEILSVAPAS